ncbi:MAG: phosphoribosylformylglycinamidine synthase I [Phycisphaerae bacterium]|nr:phosphoribosylformylglycinamidine synthase I [Phycisphaerae bacterium]
MPASPIRVLVLRTAGTNCDVETAHAWSLVGAEPDRVHINRAIADPRLLSDYQILTVPGGFSYGDDVSAGKILANQIVHHLADELHAFVDAGKLVLGICNGFQVLVKAGLLPGPMNGDEPGVGVRQPVTVTYNDSARFEDRWIHLKVATDRCVFLEPDAILALPIAHGEGKVVAVDAATLAALNDGGYSAVRYVDQQGRPGPYPINPNGSQADVAGLTDRTGRVFGLMPHPERHIHRTHHPQWTRRGKDVEPDGLMVFRRAVDYLRQ